jgi:hypothetical protein
MVKKKLSVFSISKRPFVIKTKQFKIDFVAASFVSFFFRNLPLILRGPS